MEAFALSCDDTTIIEDAHRYCKPVVNVECQAFLLMDYYLIISQESISTKELSMWACQSASFSEIDDNPSYSQIIQDVNHFNARDLDTPSRLYFMLDLALLHISKTHKNISHRIAHLEAIKAHLICVDFNKVRILNQMKDYMPFNDFTQYLYEYLPNGRSN